MRRSPQYCLETRQAVVGLHLSNLALSQLGIKSVTGKMNGAAGGKATSSSRCTMTIRLQCATCAVLTRVCLHVLEGEVKPMFLGSSLLEGVDGEMNQSHGRLVAEVTSFSQKLALFESYEYRMC